MTAIDPKKALTRGRTDRFINIHLFDMELSLTLYEKRRKTTIDFWAIVCKTVRPMLTDRCLSCLSVCL